MRAFWVTAGMAVAACSQVENRLPVGNSDSASQPPDAASSPLPPGPFCQLPCDADQPCPNGTVCVEHACTKPCLAPGGVRAGARVELWVRSGGYISARLLSCDSDSSPGAAPSRSNSLASCDTAPEASYEFLMSLARS
jgi:hypothetical protein